MTSTKHLKPIRHVLSGICLLVLSACATLSAPNQALTDTANIQTPEKFAADRAAILAMAGDYKVTFDFTETVAFQAGYELKKPYVTGAHEMVRVIEDTGTFISLQHILVVGDGETSPLMPIKHWRQDWIYAPQDIMEFVGANTWQKRPITSADSTGKWAQVVYQVDDTPRYAALASWEHNNGMSSWTSPASWRPLPRRDATKREDYHVVVASNRHAITPTGWVHEQDNAKLILTGEKPQILVHETGVNTYQHFDGFDTSVGTNYWNKTKGFWAQIRNEWAQVLSQNNVVALTVLGEPSEIYMEILGIASEVETGETSEDKAAQDAIAVLRSYLTTNPDPVTKRLRAGKSQSYSR